MIESKRHLKKLKIKKVYRICQNIFRITKESVTCLERKSWRNRMKHLIIVKLKEEILERKAILTNIENLFKSAEEMEGISHVNL